MASVSRLRKALIAFSIVGLAAITIPSSPAHAEPGGAWPSQVHAQYRIEFSGFDIGAFDFSSSVNGSTYSLSGDARISALLGAFKWNGASRTSGALTGDAPHPAGYNFNFAGTGKSGSVKMGFAGDSVTNVAHVPTYQPAAADTTPVTSGHLKGVLDPLSAVMALSRTRAENPCNRRLAIFDGKQRFDLQLAYKRQDRVADPRPTGQPGVAYVCRVRYLPIAGHKANDETRNMAANQGIEVSLRPVPSANLFIPHQIVIPTAAGTVTMTAMRVQIVTHREQIALGH